MKNESIFWKISGIMVSVLVLLFIGCADGEQGVQDVSNVYQQADPPTDFKAVKATNGNVVLTWTAASNATGYSFFYQQEGKKTIYQGFNTNSYSTGRGFIYNIAGDGTGTNPSPYDSDKWSLLLVTSNDNIPTSWASWTPAPTSNYIPAGVKFRFGIRTSGPLVYSIGSVASDIVWSDYLQF
jgi:hypothetical protein